LRKILDENIIITVKGLGYKFESWRKINLSKIC